MWRRTRRIIAPLLLLRQQRWRVPVVALQQMNMFGGGPVAPAMMMQPWMGSGRRRWLSGGGDPREGMVQVRVPEERLEFSATRSSGPGGQNVNKVATRIQLRFHVPSADWLPAEIRERFTEQQATRINRNGEYVTAAQEHRTQHRNRAECIAKLQKAVDRACIVPKQRKQYEGLSEEGKKRRVKDKQRRSRVKELRRGVV